MESTLICIRCPTGLSLFFTGLLLVLRNCIVQASDRTFEYGLSCGTHLLILFVHGSAICPGSGLSIYLLHTYKGNQSDQGSSVMLQEN